MPLAWDQLNVRIALVGRYLCEPGWRLDEVWARRQTDFDLWLVFKGRGWMELTDRRITLRPGVCLWTRPGGLYLAGQDADDRLGVNAIHFEFVDAHGCVHRDRASIEAAGLGSLPPEAFDLIDLNLADALGRRVVELVKREGVAQRQPGSAASLLLKGLLMDIDAQTTRPGGVAWAGTDRHHRELVMAAAARIAQSPGDAPSVEAMARQAGYTPDHFTRVFRGHMGVSPQAFLVRARVERACQLLIESSLPVRRIADVLGYRDPYFFSRQFRQKMGMTPGAYRRRPRGGGTGDAGD